MISSLITTLVAFAGPLFVMLIMNMIKSVTFAFTVRLVYFTIVRLTGSTLISVVFLTSVLFSSQVTFTLLDINPIPLVRTTT